MIDINYINQTEELLTREEMIAHLEALRLYQTQVNNILSAAKEKYALGLVAMTDVHEAQLEASDVENKRNIALLKFEQLPVAEDYVAKAGNYETIDLIRINIIRFGGISVTLFLIALIIPIYRYNIRLAIFYMSRADALLICKETGFSDLTTLVNLLAPTHAFEKEPTTPIDSLSMVSSALLSKK